MRSIIDCSGRRTHRRQRSHQGGSEIPKANEKKGTLEAAQAVATTELVQVAPDAVVSRTLVKAGGGTVTAFAFDAGQGLSEHSAPFDALVQLIDGDMTITIGGNPIRLGAGEMVLMPADVPHALEAHQGSRMMLDMIRDSKES